MVKQRTSTIVLCADRRVSEKKLQHYSNQNSFGYSFRMCLTLGGPWAVCVLARVPIGDQTLGQTTTSTVVHCMTVLFEIDAPPAMTLFAHA